MLVRIQPAVPFSFLAPSAMSNSKYYFTGQLMNYTLSEIIELAKDIESEDPIDWANLPLDKDKIYQMIGSQAYEVYNAQTEDQEAILLATVIKLVIENFILNLQVPGNNVSN